ncbi:MAG TPA: CRTAC1 family protein [Candidatus Limnocylindrales bacterium]|nr:CRTAC1 family protein [Candidatus Limnocylindrales bacterium]
MISAGKVTGRLPVGLFIASVALIAAHAGEAKHDPRGPGTIRMGQTLQEIAQKENPVNNIFLNKERAELIRQELAKTTSKQKPELRFSLVTELLDSGQNESALQELEALEQEVKTNLPEAYERNYRVLKMKECLCWMRIGELTNCLADHNPDSCLAPIQGRGLHRFQAGSRNAMRVLAELLEHQPDDLAARWLLNVASMTVGDYPEKVPSKWVIPPSAFASEYDIKHFPDIAGALGLDPMKRSGGSIIEDFDGDGNLDIMCSSIGFQDQLRLFHNNGDGTFSERTAEAGLIGETGGLNLIQADFNNDGFPDVLVLRGAWMRSEGRFPKSLLRNNGDGTFEDVTEAAGLLSFQPSQTAVWLDYDNDGWIDLFIGNESLGNDGNRCQLFHNNGNGTFTECAVDSGVGHVGFVKGVCSADFNHDGRPDIYLSVLGAPNVLFRNDGPVGTNATAKVVWHFTNVAKAAGVTEPLYSFPCWFFDYDNDGWEDLFVCGYHIKNVGDICADYLGLPTDAERPRLYHNNRDGTFQDVTREVGLHRVLHAMGSNFGDLDNDGFLDFYLGTGDPDLATIVPNRMFRNDGGKRFQDVTTSGGFGNLQKGHAVSFGDIDNDGDQDVYQNMGGAVSGDVYHNVLYENPGHGNHWITLKLEGVQSNRAAIGARIHVTVQNEDGEHSYYKTVGTGGSFGASPLRQEIGLGKAKEIRRVEIFWPRTGKLQVLNGLTMDRFYKVKEGETRAVPWELKSFALRSQASETQHQHHHHSP